MWRSECNRHFSISLTLLWLVLDPRGMQLCPWATWYTFLAWPTSGFDTNRMLCHSGTSHYIVLRVSVLAVSASPWQSWPTHEQKSDARCNYSSTVWTNLLGGVWSSIFLLRDDMSWHVISLVTLIPVYFSYFCLFEFFFTFVGPCMTNVTKNDKVMTQMKNDHHCNFNMSWQVAIFFTLFKILQTLGKDTQLINEQELSSPVVWHDSHCLGLSHDTCHFVTWCLAEEILASKVKSIQFWKKSEK